MEELKPCPFCGGEAKMCRGLPSTQNCEPYQTFVRCKKCGSKSKTFFQAAYENKLTVDKAAKDVWNRRSAPENKPLTLKQLRQMDNEPAWYQPEECWAVVFGGQGYVQILDFTEPLSAFVGKLYARKPAKETKS